MNIKKCVTRRHANSLGLYKLCNLKKQHQLLQLLACLGTNKCIDNPFVGPSEMTFGPTSSAKLLNVIAHNAPRHFNQSEG